MGMDCEIRHIIIIDYLLIVKKLFRINMLLVEPQLVLMILFGLKFNWLIFSSTTLFLCVYVILWLRVGAEDLVSLSDGSKNEEELCCIHATPLREKRISLSDQLRWRSWFIVCIFPTLWVTLNSMQHYLKTTTFLTSRNTVPI